MGYRYKTTKSFDRDFKKLTKKDKVFRDKVLKKIEKICESPECGKPLSNVLKNIRREHVNSYLIFYTIEGNTIIFHKLEHHDIGYKKGI